MIKTGEGEAQYIIVPTVSRSVYIYWGEGKNPFIVLTRKRDLRGEWIESPDYPGVERKGESFLFASVKKKKRSGALEEYSEVQVTEGKTRCRQRKWGRVKICGISSTPEEKEKLLYLNSPIQSAQVLNH